MLVVHIFDTLNQPFEESLIGDGLACVLYTISDEELCLTLAPEIGIAMQVHVQGPSNTEFAQCLICLIVYSPSTKMALDALALVKTLGMNPSLMKSITPTLEKHVQRLVA